jgi:large subunit ribosomal protein L21
MIVYAVVKSGGRQYRAGVGDTILVERLSVEVGQQLELDEVLLLAGDEQVKIGQPNVNGAKVLATVVTQEKGPKIRIFKYHPRKRYRRRAGHRQHYTRLRVDEIVV